VPARSHPASRSGSEDAPAGTATGRTNETSSGVVALASVELRIPAKLTANATIPVAATASHGVCDASVPRVMSTAPPATSSDCAVTRARIAPPKSTNSSVLSAPKAANRAMVALPMTTSVSAKHAGITIAPRAARRSAAASGSRRRIQPGRAGGLSRGHPGRSWGDLTGRRRAVRACPARAGPAPVRAGQRAAAVSSVRTISA